MTSDSHTAFWPAPQATNPVTATVHIPGSKSITNRALILAAIAETPTTITGALRSRDTELMAKALKSLGIGVQIEAEQDHPANAMIYVEPAPLRGGTVDCGLAGTVMRFVPPLAACANGTVFFDGDPHARKRPMSGILNGLRELGVQISGDRLPFEVIGDGAPEGGHVTIDASESSQFVSGLLLAAPAYTKGISVQHKGGKLPSLPHIEMTVAMLRAAGASVDTTVENQWTVAPGPIRGGITRVEPDLSNATPFLTAAAVTGGTVTIPNWPVDTTQPGDTIRSILTRMGCTVDLVVHGSSHDLQVTGPKQGALQGLYIDMSDIGELAPTVAALAALAQTPSQLVGISHLRGHETDRLAALAHEINNIGGDCQELSDGLSITPKPLHGGRWATYDDHRMATAGAIIGLVTEDIEIENIKTTAKTLPGFEKLWERMLGIDF